MPEHRRVTIQEPVEEKIHTIIECNAWFYTEYAKVEEAVNLT